MQAVFTTNNEAVEALVINPINAGEANADDYDIDAIADATIVQFTTPRGEVRYEQDPNLDDDEFWDIVARNNRKTPLVLSLELYNDGFEGHILQDGREIGESGFDFYTEDTVEWERLADQQLEDAGYHRVAPWTTDGTKVIRKF